MKRKLLTALAALLLSGCMASHRQMVRVERVLEAGSDSWDSYTDAKLEDCRAMNLPTETERRDCIRPTQEADEAVGKAMTAAVAALRAYWVGVAVGESPRELAVHWANLVDAVDDLPVEQFGGLRKLVK